MPKPTTGISYIPYNVWELLEKQKKLDYFDMQSTFASHHNALRLNGINDAHLPLAHTSTSRKAKVLTIFEWLSTLKAADGCLLFCDVSPSKNGEIELWHHVSHTNEAKAWLATALAEIARLSGIHLETDRPSAEDMFKNPDKVWQNLDRMNRGVSLKAQRSFFMEFSPPRQATITTPTGKRGQGRLVPAHVKLVFDLEDDTVVSLLSTDDATSRSSSNRRLGKRRGQSHGVRSAASVTPAQVDHCENAAKADAAKAVAVANAAIKKFPSQYKTAHQGDYFTTPDSFGNLFPVVFIDGKAVPLTEESLLASRKQAHFPPLRGGSVFPPPTTTSLKSPPAQAAPSILSQQTPTPPATQGSAKRWGDDDSDESDDDADDIEEVESTHMDDQLDVTDSILLLENESIVTTESDKSTGGISWAEVVSSSLYEPPKRISPGERLIQKYSLFHPQAAHQPAPVIKPPTASKYTKPRLTSAELSAKEQARQARAERNSGVATWANEIVALRNEQDRLAAAHAAELLALQQHHKSETDRYQAENNRLASLLEDVHLWMKETRNQDARPSNSTTSQQQQDEIDALRIDDAGTSGQYEDSSMVVWSPPKTRASKRSTLQAALQSSPPHSAVPTRIKKKTKPSFSPATNRFASLQDTLPEAEDDEEDEEEISQSHPVTSFERAVADTAGKIQALTILHKKQSPGPGSNGAGRQS